MKKENTSIRLKKIMDERNLRQIDIVNMCIPYCKKYDVKMNKSDISQYISGKTEPNQDKLVILGMALNVNEAWLMGFDVPIERTSMPQSQNNSLLKALYESDLKNSIVAEEFVEYKVREQFNLDSYDYKLLKAFKKLSIEGKEEAINRITELSFIPKYINEEEC